MIGEVKHLDLRTRKAPPERRDIKAGQCRSVIQSPGSDLTVDV